MTASGGREWLRVGGIEQKGKRTHGHGQQCGDWWGEGDIRGLNSNEKIQQRLYIYKIKKKENNNKKKIYLIPKEKQQIEDTFFVCICYF